MAKFGRTYLLSIDKKNGDVLIVQPPLTVEFDITRSFLQSSNSGTIRIYNLGTDNRNEIRQDVIALSDFRHLNFRAGYVGSSLSTVLDGNISHAWSVREGTNFVTQIDAFDYGNAYVNSNVSLSFPKGTSQETVINALIEQLPNVSRGTISRIAQQILTRGVTYNGNAIDILSDVTGGASFIDNGKANVLGNDECLQGVLQVITPESGLLATPVREQSILTFDMIFEPRLVIGQIVRLQSTTDINFNGNYKVCQLKHRGTISGAVCGDAITSVGLWLGPNELKVVG